ncbi:MAG TPA: DUF1998 domain-containing protein [Clostridia bacterium]|jgi:hypothetical protein|nr:DUF1998 domain-containing protein [Clostridia bacterium]HQF99403.1 DUF1998 domain-containing protein [Clostridia bacterium]HQH66368.1 DUF1998 domain-containing protein [Clostridia bacterium]HQJ93116.1 DUF1998 domain-containing protein [Clostridia bacterium]
MELENAERIRLNHITHSVRASQAVLQYGVGAMVDFKDQTLMTAAPEYWREQIIEIHDERLEKALRVDFFGIPAGKNNELCKEGISYARFPEWYFCPKCRKFQPIKHWIDEYKRKGRKRAIESDPYMVKHMCCPICNQDLVVARIVTVCEHGHIDDFPWVKWVHCKNSGGAKIICNRPSLTFKTGASSTEGLEGLVITCETCGAKTTLKEAFDREIFEELDKKHNNYYNFTCSGRHPWKNQKESCSLYPKVLQRGSSSVYFPVIVSSLVIPPYSSMLTRKIEESSAFSECKNVISAFMRNPYTAQESKDAIIVNQIDHYSNQMSLEINVSPEKIKQVLERKWRQPSEEEYSTLSVKYRAEEYDALSGEISLGKDIYGDFQRESTDIVAYNLPYIKRISLIHKVREVQALTGFSRIRPVDRTEPVGKQVNVVPIKEPTTNWYPAYEVRGEGIFIEFNQEAINNWRSENRDLQLRIDRLNENYSKSFISSGNPRTVTSKYVLLHTISHLLIKQLSFECGYSIASLKERIYCSEGSEGKEMAGILIYTASGDSEGTLGGLVRQGYPDTFPNIFKKAIKSSEVCSNDPVCSLSLGQGRDSLNLAACYSCALIPETSCEEFNIFLDRGTVAGVINNYRLGFFYEQLHGNRRWESFVTHTEDSSANRKTNLQVIIPEKGTDMSDVSYADIWKSVKEWTDNLTERSLLDKLINIADICDSKEKPVYECSFIIAGDSKKYRATLLWEKSKVMYFSSDYKDTFEKITTEKWKCFCGDNKIIDATDILNAIGGK